MSTFSRTRDIIAANVIDLVNRSDDPAKTIRVVILEMEETLVEVRASAARSIADLKEKRRQLTQLGQLQDSWTERAGLALSKGRDDLARAALIEKEKLGELADEIGDEIADIDSSLRANEADIAKLQAKLREARVRQNAIATRLESAENRARLRETCRVIYLRASANDLFRRLRHDQKRPLLQVADPLERLKSLQAERDPLYKETAHFTIDAGRSRVHQVVNRLAAQIELGGDGSEP